MKYKVSELTGARLDAAVAMGVGKRWRIVTDADHTGMVLPPDGECRIPSYWDSENPFNWDLWAPSKDWSMGGPIIERARIDCTPKDGRGMFLGVPQDGPRWLANCPGRYCETGRTLLIAAMRAYVASKFGDEVELP